jgi:hypothetical protein
MREFAVIGALVLTMSVVLWAGDGRVKSPQAVQAGQTDGATPAQRLATLERKMANLEKIVGVPLEDDAAIAGIVREQQAAQAAVTIRQMMSTLIMIRSQNELYMVQHNGVYPDLAQGWDALTKPTDAQGRTALSEQAKRNAFGPYLQATPVNPYTNSDKVVTRTQDAGPHAGWYFNRETGDLKAIIPKSEAELYQIDARDVLTY